MLFNFAFNETLYPTPLCNSHAAREKLKTKKKTKQEKEGIPSSIQILSGGGQNSMVQNATAAMHVASILGYSHHTTAVLLSFE